jgi:hypothetical protein
MDMYIYQRLVVRVGQTEEEYIKFCANMGVDEKDAIVHFRDYKILREEAYKILEREEKSECAKNDHCSIQGCGCQDPDLANSSEEISAAPALCSCDRRTITPCKVCMDEMDKEDF